MSWRSGLAALALVASAAGAAENAGIVDPVRVSFRGACASQVLEVEVFDRALAQWQPHREHPLILAGSCQIEDAGYLMNEIRTRCRPAESDPEPQWYPGVPVYRQGVIDRCQPPQGRAPKLRIEAPAPGATIRNETQTVRVEGRVEFDLTLTEAPRSPIAQRLAAAESASLPAVTFIRIEHAEGDLASVSVVPRDDGRFDATIRARPGANRLSVTAFAANAQRGNAVVEFEFDYALVREKWLRGERERIERLRARQRGEIEIEVVEPEGGARSR